MPCQTAVFVLKTAIFLAPSAPLLPHPRSMQLDAQPSGSEGRLTVRVPPTRSDILHACDVMEDVAIAYGYNNLPMHVSLVLTC